MPFNPVFLYPAIAETFFDDRAADAVFLSLYITAKHRKTTRADLVFPRIQLAMILSECVSNVADCAYSEAEQIGLGMRCVSLKVSMQRTVLVRSDEVVIAGGLLGRITETGDQFLTIEIANGVQVKVQRHTVTSVLPKGTLKSA